MPIAFPGAHAEIGAHGRPQGRTTGARTQWGRFPMTTPTQFEAEQQVAAARARFGRFLGIWASQLLELDRTGLRQPSWEPIEPADPMDGWSIAA